MGYPPPLSVIETKIFLSNFWQSLFNQPKFLLSINLSSFYHLQTDGQTKRVDHCFENYLRCMTGTHPKKWVKWLTLVEWWYNTTFHNSIKMTPLEALYGYAPPQLQLHQFEATKVPTVDEF